jgi:superfamily II DNA or RNA helicase
MSFTRVAQFLNSIGSVSAWSEWHARLAESSEKEKGDRFEDLTQAFLQISPLYRSQLKSVWRLEEIPPTVRLKLKLPATDKGIDLVAETHKGEFWAIQCKYRQDTDQQLTHTDISTFTSLTFQACKGFSFALVCSTTERVTSLYRGEERIGFCALDTWQDLDAEFFDLLRARLTSKPAVLKPCSPRPHQENALRDGLAHFTKGKSARGKLIMPCGTGKSLTAWFLAQALKSKRIVIAVPSLSLVKQTLKVWSRESAANDIDVDWICVCSDETAGKADQDDVVVQRQDIAVPCYTSTDKIAEWLRSKHKGLTVVFTTYQSGDILATAARKAKFSFDLGIMDEAHKTVGDSDKQFSILLHDHNIEIGQRIFMTATERRYKGSSDKVLSMDNLDVYGDTFHQLSFKQAMECQPPILCDYNVITIGVSRQEIKDLIKQNVFVRPTGGKWDEEMEADMLAAMVALRKAMKEYPIKHAVSFHGSIQRAELFKAHNDTFTHEFPEFGGLETFHVSGQTPTGTRSNIIKCFAKAERSLVTNARCLTEGVDVPGIDCVLFADPRKSTVDIVQAVGRALRPSEGKKLGYVILPVLHETDASSEQVIDSGAFKEILSTISALAANDDRIIEYFRGISQGRIPSGSSRVSFEWDERLARNIDVAKLVRELEIKCWGRLAKLSWRPFEQARGFARSLNLESAKEWYEYCVGRMPRMAKKPADIPSNPSLNYGSQGWVGFGDWLGTGNIHGRDRDYMPFEKARDWARSLKLKGNYDWRAAMRSTVRPITIPAAPDVYYKSKGWVSWADWLGTNNIGAESRSYMTFKEARAFVRKLGLKNRDEWVSYCKGELLGRSSKPISIPSTPERLYRGKGWMGVGDWLGTGNISNQEREYRSYDDARKFVHKLRLTSAEEWRSYCKGEILGRRKLPKDIPAAPHNAYKNKGWIGMGDWLGTGAIAARLRKYRPFTEARKFAIGLKLKGQKDWRKYCQGKFRDLQPLPSDIPANPNQVYGGDGWNGYGDWVGTGSISPRYAIYRGFTEAREFARKLCLKDVQEWRLFVTGKMPHKGKLPRDIPKAPEQVYADSGWQGSGDWLGTGSIATFNRQYKSFKDARDYVRSLGLKSAEDWRLFCKGLLPGKGDLPKDIPAGPRAKYLKTGWKGFPDWLGTDLQK